MNMKYIHLRRPFALPIGADYRIVPDNLGGVTVAYRESDTGIKYAFAHFKDSDNFAKAKGRIKAGGKTFSKKWAYDFDGTPKQFFSFIRQQFADEGYLCYSKRSHSFLSQ